MTASEKFNEATETAALLAALLEQYDEENAPVVKLRSFIVRSKQVADLDKEAVFTNKLQESIAQRDNVLRLLEERTRRSGIAAVRDYIEELAQKIELAGRVRNRRHANRAAYEFAVKTGDYDTPEKRTEAEAQLTKDTSRFEKAVELVTEMIGVQSALIVPATTGLSLV
jgi:hypothetical protein